MDLAGRTQLKESLLISYPAGKQRAESAAVNNGPSVAEMVGFRRVSREELATCVHAPESYTRVYFTCTRVQTYTHI